MSRTKCVRENWMSGGITRVTDCKLAAASGLPLTARYGSSHRWQVWCVEHGYVKYVNNPRLWVQEPAIFCPVCSAISGIRTESHLRRIGFFSISELEYILTRRNELGVVEIIDYADREQYPDLEGDNGPEWERLSSGKKISPEALKNTMLLNQEYF